MSSRRAVFNSARWQRSAGRREVRTGGGGFDKYPESVPIHRSSEPLRQLEARLAAIDAQAKGRS
jgi:hypothetical protein